MRAKQLAILVCLAALMQGCGGGGGKKSPPPPSATVTITINYLRVAPAYDGWGLHLWGNAIAGTVAPRTAVVLLATQ